MNKKVFNTLLSCKFLFRQKICFNYNMLPTKKANAKSGFLPQRIEM